MDSGPATPHGSSSVRPLLPPRATLVALLKGGISTCLGIAVGWYVATLFGLPLYSDIAQHLWPTAESIRFLPLYLLPMWAPSLAIAALALGVQRWRRPRIRPRLATWLVAGVLIGTAYVYLEVLISSGVFGGHPV